LDDPIDSGASGAAPNASDERANSIRTAVIVGAFALFLLIVVGVAVAKGRNGSSSGTTDAGAPSTTTATTAKAGAPGTTTTKKPAMTSVCAKGNWPPIYDGKSAKLTTDPSANAYVWRENDGWSVRAIDPNGSDVKIVLTGSAALNPADFKAVSPDGGELKVTANTATFTVKGSDKANGFDFKACFLSELTIQIWAGDALWPAPQIVIGKNNMPLDIPIRAARSGA